MLEPCIEGTRAVGILTPYIHHIAISENTGPIGACSINHCPTASYVLISKKILSLSKSSPKTYPAFTLMLYTISVNFQQYLCWIFTQALKSQITLARSCLSKIIKTMHQMVEFLWILFLNSIAIDVRAGKRALGTDELIKFLSEGFLHFVSL